ncbi:MAG: hypothetical protein QOE05_3512, partial [Actinomycetota bacterium]|nr:hypothetical protein [Actinomycetota bacterium]
MRSSSPWQIDNVTESAIRVFLLDDHEIVRRGV